MNYGIMSACSPPPHRVERQGSFYSILLLGLGQVFEKITVKTSKNTKIIQKRKIIFAKGLEEKLKTDYNV